MQEIRGMSLQNLSDSWHAMMPPDLLNEFSRQLMLTLVLILVVLMRL